MKLIKLLLLCSLAWLLTGGSVSTRRAYRKKLKQRLKKQVTSSLTTNLLTHPIAEAQLVVVIDWLLGKGSCSSAAMAEHVERTTKGLHLVCLGINSVQS
ncbi:hypothetical protein [Planctobacterium marinum]|uniref:Uncharacterized protein n=1 Tax=Planctobacterium marinum TaxID=1631968 RepID=A0AA48KTK7_9ALTE|nr:hypothetical protein MACH26_38030 [Planctobacterium marinum]